MARKSTSGFAQIDTHDFFSSHQSSTSSHLTICLFLYEIPDKFYNYKIEFLIELEEESL